MSEHRAQVKFTGTGYRAYCLTCQPTWFGQVFQFVKYIGYGGQAQALRKSQMLAEDDARRHRREERRKALARQRTATP